MENFKHVSTPAYPHSTPKMIKSCFFITPTIFLLCIILKQILGTISFHKYFSICLYKIKIF